MISQSVREKEMRKCPNFLTCNASMCIFDPEYKKCIWFPGDGICKKSFPPGWVKTQKKIRKKIKEKYFNTYFTYEMLSRSFVVGKGISGLDADRSESEQLKVWFRRHPIKKVLSEEEKQVLRERFKEKCLFKMERQSVRVLNTG